MVLPDLLLYSLSPLFLSDGIDDEARLQWSVLVLEAQKVGLEILALCLEVVQAWPSVQACCLSPECSKIDMLQRRRLQANVVSSV